MKRSRDLPFILGVICFMGILSGCSGTEPAVQTPTTINVTQQAIETTPTATTDPGEARIRSVDGMAMANVPSGIFKMGSTDTEIEDAIALCQQHYSICNRWFYERESPQHPVELTSFWMDQTEVSNAQYRLCVDAGICAEPSTCKKGTPTFRDPNKADHPVVCVGWEEAQDYCEWVGARLPTAAEWEYAFRGKAGLIFPWGNEFDGSRLNYCDQNCSQIHADDRFNDGYAQTAPVGSYPSGASWSDIFNMSGNVSEWVGDWFGDYSPGSELDPIGPSSGSEKMIKGCSWFFHPTYCRGTLRASIDPDTRFDYLGFRCAVSADQENEERTDMTSGSIVVPAGISPAIDGSMSSGEWDDATVEYFADGSELFLMHADDYLYLGIRANNPEMIAGNVYIQRGDEIEILHSSAALGTAIYQKGEDNWQQIQDFTWQCRDTSDSDAARAEQDAFLQQEGWLAANSRIGTPEELEYQIGISDDTLRLAVSFIRASNPNEKIPWPANLDDDCIKPTPGGLPENLYFSTEQWVPLEVSR